MTKNYSFFTHSTCENFPCHEQADPDNFNCLFCYCPFYMLGDQCGGDFVYLENGVKDCSGCLYPHRRENYDEIMARYDEIATKVSRASGTSETDPGLPAESDPVPEAGTESGLPMESEPVQETETGPGQIMQSELRKAMSSRLEYAANSELAQAMKTDQGQVVKAELMQAVKDRLENVRVRDHDGELHTRTCRHRPISRAVAQKVRSHAEEMEKSLLAKMKEHLDTFNDGVIAIFITIMVLEIPFPSGSTSYGTFLEDILIFLVSFFVVADFWYESHRSFASFENAGHGVVVMDFLFLASLALIPVMTKWIMNDMSSLAVINYGIVYFLTTIFESLIFFSAHWQEAKKFLRRYIFIMVYRVIFIMALNVALIVLALFRPRVAMILYLMLPIISFFFPLDKLQKKNAKRRYKARAKKLTRGCTINRQP